MYGRMQADMHESVCMLVSKYLYAFTYKHKVSHIFAVLNTYMQASKHTCIYVHSVFCISTIINTYMCASAHICTHIHICVHTCIKNIFPVNVFQTKNYLVIIDVKEQIWLPNEIFCDFHLTLDRHKIRKKKCICQTRIHKQS